MKTWPTITTLLIFFLFNFALHAEEGDCTYKISPENIRVKWEAFKTPAKVGVEGQFKSSKIQGDDSGKNITEIIKKTKIFISTNSVFTKDASRDKKIFDNFFASMKGGSEIEAQVVEVKAETLVVSITMNGIQKNVPMNFSEQNGNFRADGWIDVMDFAMSDQLKSLTAACNEKHEGKTWSDISVELHALFKKKCQ